MAHPLKKYLFQYLGEAKNVVVFTGGGISEPSGVKTWSQMSRMYREEIVLNEQGWKFFPHIMWKYWDERRGEIFRSEPNFNHYTLAQLQEVWEERGGKLTIVTTNQDGLHQEADSKVIELNGSINELECETCENIQNNNHYPLLDQNLLAQIETLPPYTFLVKNHFIENTLPEYTNTLSITDKIPEDVSFEQLLKEYLITFFSDINYRDKGILTQSWNETSSGHEFDYQFRIDKETKEHFEFRQKVSQIIPRCNDCQSRMKLKHRNSFAGIYDIPNSKREELKNALMDADMMFSIGVSGRYFPTYPLIPVLATIGIPLCEINTNPTIITPFATWTIRGSSGEALTDLLSPDKETDESLITYGGILSPEDPQRSHEEFHEKSQIQLQKEFGSTLEDSSDIRNAINSLIDNYNPSPETDPYRYGLSQKMKRWKNESENKKV